MNLGNIPKVIVTFLGEARTEVHKVNWPTREQTVRYTLIVIGLSVVIAMYLGGIDFVLNQILNKLISLKQ